ncbi:MAG TPA: hypothetical protein VIE65_10830 [Methylobacter sp.]
MQQEKFTKYVKVDISFVYSPLRPIRGGRLPKKMVAFGDKAGTTIKFVVAGLRAINITSGRINDVRYKVGVIQPKLKKIKNNNERR